MDTLLAAARECGYRPVGIWLLLLCLFFALFGIPGQSQVQTQGATVEGAIRDTSGHSVSGATVSLQMSEDRNSQILRTDSDGAYHFSGLKAGTYRLSAQFPGMRDTNFGPFALGQNETRRINLSFQPATASKGNAVSSAPEFYDEPQFTVAGVTEAAHPGGHGSDPAMRTTEKLVKETVALNSEAPINSVSAPVSSEKERALSNAVHQEPESFGFNSQLGKLLFDAGRIGESIPYLEKAAHLNPRDYTTVFELASAYARTGDYPKAQHTARTLAGQPDTAELHHLLGEVEERRGDPLAAVHDYQRAAELQASEPNFFDWGAELLLHRALEPAVEVFTKGNRLFPRSVRMLTGLGVAWYARGSFEEAVSRLCDASDLDPNDPMPYVFLGQISIAESDRSPSVAGKFERFLRLQPNNAYANLYYALSIWNRQRGTTAPEYDRIKALLEKAVQIDPKLGIAHLQLGILYADEGDLAKAESAYQAAIAASPDLEEAHYRLAQAYRKTGDKSKAQVELERYDELTRKTKLEAEQERRAIQDFVYTSRDRPDAAPH